MNMKIKIGKYQNGQGRSLLMLTGAGPLLGAERAGPGGSLNTPV